MSLYKQIKIEQLEARKAKLELHTKLFTTLLGEIQGSIVGGKTPVEYEEDGSTLKVSDQDTLKVINKFIKSAKETLKLQPDNTTVSLELKILETFLPKQLTVLELGEIVGKLMANRDPSITGGKLMGYIMSQLKKDYDGMFDASLVKSLIEAK